jgi:hypothetical protein
LLRKRPHSGRRKNQHAVSPSRVHRSRDYSRALALIEKTKIFSSNERPKWAYKQSTGELLDAEGVHVSTGYSGAPAGKNNPAMQDVPTVGPIPRGEYTIGSPFDSPTHGPFAMHLEADPTNEMFGRDGFLMHGDSVEHPGAASAGCVIKPRLTRERVWESKDHLLRVL